jgi:adenylate kinase family enzyme
VYVLLCNGEFREINILINILKKESSMQRIWITGSGGSGKTTLANLLGNKLNIEVYHRDRISWMENWQIRPENEQNEIVIGITEKDRWIFEGNMFTVSKQDGRFHKCDTIIFININRFICLYRTIIRYIKHRKNKRPDLADGCEEDYSIEFVKYIMYDFPKKNNERQRLFIEAQQAGKTVIILNGRKSVKRWCEGL